MVALWEENLAVAQWAVVVGVVVAMEQNGCRSLHNLFQLSRR